MNKWIRVIIEIAGVVLVLILLYNLDETRNERDRYYRNQGSLEQSYQEHLVDGYKKTICNVSQGFVPSEKDLACIGGVKEKARKEIEALVKK